MSKFELSSFIQQRSIKPFIKRFKTKDHHYVYDVNTNRILRVGKLTYIMAGSAGKYSQDQYHHLLRGELSPRSIEESYESMLCLQDRYHVFSALKPRFRGSRAVLDEELLLSHYEKEKIEQMCLEPTQQCNLRCRYCVHSGKYKFQRAHSPRTMDFPTAKRAIDFYLKKFNENKWNISFYGGEPLLRFDFIKKCIEYINSFGLRTQHGIRIITNGTLLKESYLNFFKENNVDLQISLDGPAKHHDLYRLYKNGKGSFGTIIDNLEMIKKFDASYFREHIMFMCVITPSTNLLELDEYFLRDNLVKDVVLARLGPLDVRENSFLKECGENKNQREEISQLWQTFKDNTLNNGVGRYTILDRNFIHNYSLVYKRIIRERPQERVPINGPCMPGLRRLFVSSDGNYHMCEKINPLFPIGDVYRGFVYRKIKSIWENFLKLVNDKNCLNCWALNLCNLCFAHVCKDGSFELHNRSQFCSWKKKEIAKLLVEMAYFEERKPLIFGEWFKNEAQ